MDSVDEVLTSFVTRRGSGLVGIEGEATFFVAATDVGAVWTLRSPPHGVTTATDSTVVRDDSIAGSREALALVLWSRLPPKRLEATGTGRFLDAWDATVRVRYGWANTNLAAVNFDAAVLPTRARWLDAVCHRAIGSGDRPVHRAEGECRTT